MGRARPRRTGQTLGERMREVRRGWAPDLCLEGLAGRFCSLAAVAKDAGSTGVWDLSALPVGSRITW